MILIDTSPCRDLSVRPIRIKVIGQSGKRLDMKTYQLWSSLNPLGIPFYDALQTSVYGASYDITSDEQEFTYDVLNYSPIYTGLFLVVARVIDSSGNVVESTMAYILHAPDVIEFTVPSKAIVYIIVNGLTMLRYEYKAGETVTIPNERGITAIVWYEGRLIIYRDGEKIYDVSAKCAIFDLNLSIDRSIAKTFVRYIDDPDVARIVYKVPEIADAVGAVAFIRSMFMEHKWDVLVKEISADNNCVYLTLRIIADIGSPIDWLWSPTILTVITGGIVLGAGILTANPALIALGSGIIVGAIEVEALSKSSEESISDIKARVEETVTTFKQKSAEWKGSLEDYLDQLVEQGKITEEEKQVILSYVEKIISEALEAMNKIKEMVDEAYKRGYKDGVESAKIWIGVAGGVGFLLGYIIGSR